MVRNRLHRLFFSFFALILLVSLPSFASAEIIDDITVHSDSNGDVEAVIKFSVPIQYLRHFPQGKSASTTIYFNILGSVPVDEWQDYESRRTPPSDVIQEIAISTLDRGTGPKVHITFYRPADFSVFMGKDNQTLLIHVKAVAAQQQHQGQTAPVPVAIAKPVAAVPVVAPGIAKTPAVTTPTAPAVAAVSVKPAAAGAKTVSSPPAAAAPVAPVSVTPVGDGVIDDITLHTDATGEVNAEVKFALPLRYLRHFPKGKSEFTSIYFDPLKASSGKWKNYESHTTPSSDLIKDITVSTRDKVTGPKILVRLNRPASFAVFLAKNDRSLFIHISPVTSQKNNEGKSASGISGGAAALVAVPVVALPAITRTSTPSTPTVAVAATPAPAPTPAPTVAVAPIVSVAPSGDVTKPNVVLPQSKLKPVHIPLGGKDGLPLFPEIDQPVPLANVPPSEKPSLADQITKANNEAGALMANGGNALLTGQTFAAIDSFNKVLSLPPNKYTQDAQLWIGIARERTGQLAKGILEFETYLKLYPDGKSAKWVKDRLVQLKLSQPSMFMAVNKPVPVAAKVQNTELQYSEFGSLSMYYYQGASQTTTAVAAGAVQTPTSFSTTDQKSLMTNVNMTARSYNNEYDNRLVFQDFYAANFLPGQASSSRLGAAYYEMKDRIVDYSFKVGRQSGLGGGVMGRFDGVSAGYGFTSNWRANVVAGQLSDYTLDAKPTFYGGSVDFGTRSPFGGSVYLINQTVSGFTDRRATGGNLRYFDQRFSIMSMLDYDLQFKAVNIFTVQGTLNGGGTANDYNFLIDQRRSPILDVRNAISGTTATIASLQQNGFTMSDLVLLANQRTTTSNLAQVGMTNHLSQKWIIGTDFTVSKTAGLAASGTLLADGTQGVEGFVPASPSTGNTWTLSERATGFGIIRPSDTTNFSVSYTKGQLSKSEAFQASNHVDLQEKWTLDTTLHLGVQSDNTGGTSDDISPTARVTYKLRRNLSTDAQLGLDWSKTTSSVLQSSTTSHREFFSLGFQLLF